VGPVLCPPAQIKTLRNRVYPARILPRRESTETIPTSLESLANTAPSVLITKALGPFFCELHGILPMLDGKVAVRAPIHPAIAARIRRILGLEAPFVANTSPGFQKVRGKFERLHLPQAALLEQLVEAGVLSKENAERIQNMNRLVTTPLDRLLVQLGLANRKQVFNALRRSGGVDAAADNDHRPAPGYEGLLAPGFSSRTGVIVHHVDADGVVLRLSGMLSSEELGEIFERCEGFPLRFELLAP
jgi:hypothetical protein